MLVVCTSTWISDFEKRHSRCFCRTWGSIGVTFGMDRITNKNSREHKFRDAKWETANVRWIVVVTKVNWNGHNRVPFVFAFIFNVWDFVRCVSFWEGAFIDVIGGTCGSTWNSMNRCRIRNKLGETVGVANVSNGVKRAFKRGVSSKHREVKEVSRILVADSKNKLCGVQMKFPVGSEDNSALGKGIWLWRMAWCDARKVRKQFFWGTIEKMCQNKNYIRKKVFFS